MNITGGIYNEDQGLTCARIKMPLNVKFQCSKVNMLCFNYIFFSLIFKSAAHQQNSKWGFPLLKCQQAMKLLKIKGI
jgi:hypothetical protein